MNGPSSEIHLRERHKLPSKSAVARSSSSLSSAAEGDATVGTCHHVSPRARDASSAQQWGCVGTFAAGKWVWLGKCTYGLSRELAVLLSVETTALGESPPLLLSCSSSSLLPLPPNVPVSPRTPEAKRQEQQLQERHWDGLISDQESSTSGSLRGSCPGHLGLVHQGCSFWNWGLHVSSQTCPRLSLFPEPSAAVVHLGSTAMQQDDQGAPSMGENLILPSQQGWLPRLQHPPPRRDPCTKVHVLD